MIHYEFPEPGFPGVAITGKEFAVLPDCPE